MSQNSTDQKFKKLFQEASKAEKSAPEAKKFLHTLQSQTNQKQREAPMFRIRPWMFLGGLVTAALVCFLFFPNLRQIIFPKHNTATLQHVASEKIDNTPTIESYKSGNTLPIEAHKSGATSPQSPRIPEGKVEPNSPSVITTSKFSILGSLEKASIRRVIRRAMPGVKLCSERALQTDPTLEGKVTVAFVIGADGNVADSKGQATGQLPLEVVSCVSKQIKQLKFPAPEDGKPVKVTYPFIFKPALSSSLPSKSEPTNKKLTETSTEGYTKLELSGDVENDTKVVINNLNVTKFTRVIRQDTNIRSCYKARLQKDSKIQGKVTVVFLINSDGSVGRATSKHSDLPDEMTECITEKIKKLKFPKLREGPLEITYPFLFKPAS